MPRHFGPVSYTHLDVYKRQALHVRIPADEGRRGLVSPRDRKISSGVHRSANEKGPDSRGNIEIPVENSTFKRNSIKKPTLYAERSAKYADGKNGTDSRLSKRESYV